MRTFLDATCLLVIGFFVLGIACGDADPTPSAGPSTGEIDATSSGTGGSSGAPGTSGVGSTSGPGSSAEAGTSPEGGSSSEGESSSEGASSSGEGTCPGDAPTIPFGSAVDIDGVAAEGEWDDAAQFSIDAGVAWEVSVGIKHDGEALLLVFTEIQPPSPPPIAFPEVMLDVGDDKADTLEADDWWFHVSGTDCSASGEFDNYRGCVPEGDGWEANNFPMGMLISLVEIRIEFTTIGFDPLIGGDLGLLLRLSDTQGFAAHWPQGGDPSVPATWSAIRVCSDSPG